MSYHQRYYDYHHDNHYAYNYEAPRFVRTPSDICQNITLIEQCDVLKINGFTIHSPELLPTCLMALILGLTLAHKVYNMNTKNSFFYALTFGMIGIMMTDAGWNDCLLPNLFPKNAFVHIFFGVIDVGLTSSIGYLFLINGLLDAGILSPKSQTTWDLLGGGIAVIFGGWIYTFLADWTPGYLVLYMGVVGIGCGLWTGVQLYLVIESKDWASLKYLLLAGFHGGFGFYSLLGAKLRTWLCNNFGCHFATDFIWFLVTDTAMYYIYLYYKSRVRNQDQPKPKSLRL